MDSNRTTFLPFDIPAPDAWTHAAKQELQGAEPWETLVVKKGNLSIQPIYNDTPQQSTFSLTPSANIFGGARSWSNMPRIEVTDELHANALALEYLNTGAEGILFDCKKDTLEWRLLLKEIQLEICPISFLLDTNQSHLALQYVDYMRGYPAKEQISGAIFWNKMPANFTEISASAKSVSHFYPFGFHVVSHNESDIEIAQALKNAVSFINDAVGKGIAPHQIFNQISFSVEIGTDFFKEIATLKALRFLWYQIGGAYGISKQEPLHIHAKSSRWINEHYQPHGNMIKSTTSGMAAVLGGCDSLTIEPEDITNSMMNRIARNVSSVIKEESHFSKVADATDGSHYLDSLTEQLSEKAWKIFQSMVNA